MFLRQSTARVVPFGPFVDPTDGKTLVTTLVSALDHASTGIKLSKNGGALTIRHATVTASTYDALGNYLCTLDTTDTNTLGHMRMQFADATTNLPVWMDFEVITAVAFDAYMATSGGFLPNAAAGASGGVFINGTNTGTISISGGWTFTGTVAFSDGITVARSTNNQPGISVAGAGTGAGISVIPGATGNGILVIGGATSGSAVKFTGTAGNAIGFEIAGQGSAAGFQATGGATGAAFKLVGGGTSGEGILISTTSGDGIKSAPTAGHGLNLVANGTSKHGLFATGGTAGTSDGAKFSAGTGGVDFRAAQVGDITGNLSGSVGGGGTMTLAASQPAVTFTAFSVQAGTLTFNGATNFTGGVTANSFGITNALAIGGALTIGGAFTVTGATSFAAITASGTVTFNAFTVTNAFTINGTAMVAQTGDSYAIVNHGTYGNAQLARTSVTGTIANQTSILNAVNAIQNLSARSGPRVPAFMPRPTAGSSVYTGDLILWQLDGDLQDADANAVTIHARNSGGTSRDAGLTSTTMTRISTGFYRFTYTVASTDTAEEIAFDFTWTISASPMRDAASTEVQDAENYAALVAIQARTDLIGTNAADSPNAVTAQGTISTNLNATISSRMATYTQPTGFLAATFPGGTLASTTNITAGAITTVTNLTNAPTAGDFTATMKTSITTAATSATPTVTLAASQTLYAPAKAGDAMTLTAAYDAAKTAATQTSVNTAVANTTNIPNLITGTGTNATYTAAALANAPSGGGGSGATTFNSTQLHQIRDSMATDLSPGTIIGDSSIDAGVAIAALAAASAATNTVNLPHLVTGTGTTSQFTSFALANAPSGGASVLITPITSTVSAGEVASNEFVGYQNFAQTVTFTIVDGDGTPIPLTGKTVRFTASQKSVPNTPLIIHDNALVGGITLSTASTNTLILSITAADTAAIEKLIYGICDVTDDKVIGRGVWDIQPISQLIS